ncbi:MAG: hypothetical protein U1F43_29190 [Myxococcota bacterium]
MSISADELIAAVVEILPLQVGFGAADSGRFIRLERPSEVEFVPRVGLRLRCSGVLGYPVPILSDEHTINTAVASVGPVIVELEDGEALAFQVVLDELDMKRVPGFIDDTLLASANERLAAQPPPLAWRFPATLTHAFPLGPRVALVSHAQVTTKRGWVEVTQDGIVMSVSSAVSFARAPLGGAVPAQSKASLA